MGQDPEVCAAMIVAMTNWVDDLLPDSPKVRAMRVLMTTLLSRTDSRGLVPPDVVCYVIYVHALCIDISRLMADYVRPRQAIGRDCYSTL